jgi:hypothetical protein
LHFWRAKDLCFSNAINSSPILASARWSVFPVCIIIFISSSFLLILSFSPIIPYFFPRPPFIIFSIPPLLLTVESTPSLPLILPTYPHSFLASPITSSLFSPSTTSPYLSLPLILPPHFFLVSSSLFPSSTTTPPYLKPPLIIPHYPSLLPLVLQPIPHYPSSSYLITFHLPPPLLLTS